MMPRRTSASLLALAAALSGCNLAPRYARPGLPVAAALPAGPAYATGTTPAADVAWSDFFVEPRLRTLIGIALANNRDLRVALANVAQARAQYRVQRADLFPTIAADGSATYQKSPAGLSSSGATTTPGAVGGGAIRTDIYSASVGVSAWEIDLFGRVRNLSQAALEQYLAADENRNAAQVSLIAELATAWATMAADQDRLRIANDTRQAFGQTLALTRARFTKGIASELEVRQAQTTFEQARSDIASATTLVAQDQNALNLLAGTTVTADLLPAGLGSASPTIDQLPANLPSQVLLRRPDIAAAEHQLIAANARIGAARAAFFPNISLTAAFGTLSLGLGNLFGGGSNFWSVAPSITLPIFDFGRNKGNLRYAEATRDAAVATYEKSIQTGFREVADALARRGTIDEQLRAQTALLDAAQGAYRLSQARFRAGIDPFLTTLDSQRALYTAQQSQLDTRLTRVANAVELYRSLGGGLR